MPRFDLSDVRRLAKRAAEVALTRGGATRLGRYLHRDRPLILAYHNVLPDGAKSTGERSLHVSCSEFRRHLDLLGSMREVVPLHDLWRPTRSGGPRAALTFDDAYRGALTVGVSEVARRDMPATIFVAPELVGDVAFWWDRLAEAFEGGVMPAKVRQRALWEMKGRQREVIGWARVEGLRSSTPDAHSRSGTEEELREAAAVDGISIASHTWSHPNLAALDRDDVEQELSRARQWVHERFSPPAADWLSYPYGLDSPEVCRIAAEVHDAAVRVRGGFAPRAFPQTEGPRFRIPRLNVPAGLTLENLELRLSGLVGS